MCRWRLILDSAADGAWNMAVDDALAASAAGGGGPALRLYAWSLATLSLGYFQPLADRARHAASQSAPVVRRASGGGAIVHDRETTYALAVPAGHRLGHDAQTLYAIVHETLAAALAAGGIGGARLAGEQPRRARRDEPFLCFARRSEFDLVLRGNKIAGSAQRRRAGAVLQHGSILWRRSALAPELAGALDLASGDRDESPIVSAWIERLAAALDADFEPSALTPAELRQAERMARERYASSAWTERRRAGKPLVPPGP